MDAIKTHLTAALILATFSAAAVDIVAHRGASYDAPENTVASFKLGFAQGADACECDIHVTKDRQLMVMHDRNTLRTTGVSNEMSQATSTDLRQLEAGQWGEWKGKGFSEKLPFPQELLAVVPAGKRIFAHLDLKPDMLPELKRQLAASGKEPSQIVLIGFDYEAMKQAKALMPQYEVLCLYGADRKTKQYPPVETLIEKALAAKLDGLDLYYEFPIDLKFVQKVHQAGLKLHVWTVDDPEAAHRQAAAGVDGITTNRPRWLRDQLKSTAKP
jgi:glycerophosphoryl diester phosphodiesterase